MLARTVPETGTIKALIFDLDGTLYINRAIEQAIHESALHYLAKLKGVTPANAAILLRETREQLATTGLIATLSHAVLALGGDLGHLHDHFATEIDPARFLARDARVVQLLEQLAQHFDLYVYTNNNPRLAAAILRELGLAGLFRQIFTIEDTWCPKPDQASLEKIFTHIQRESRDCLFVGDRFDVDLGLPESMGSAVLEVKSIEDLLQLAKLLEEK
jgi:putative hydrolase of the HAD superfamily